MLIEYGYLGSWMPITPWPAASDLLADPCEELANAFPPLLCLNLDCQTGVGWRKNWNRRPWFSLWKLLLACKMSRFPVGSSAQFLDSVEASLFTFLEFPLSPNWGYELFRGSKNKSETTGISMNKRSIYDNGSHGAGIPRFDNSSMVNSNVPNSNNKSLRFWWNMCFPSLQKHHSRPPGNRSWHRKSLYDQKLVVSRCFRGPVQPVSERIPDPAGPVQSSAKFDAFPRPASVESWLWSLR